MRVLETYIHFFTLYYYCILKCVSYNSRKSHCRNIWWSHRLVNSSFIWVCMQYIYVYIYIVIHILFIHLYACMRLDIRQFHIHIIINVIYSRCYHYILLKMLHLFIIVSIVSCWKNLNNIVENVRLISISRSNLIYIYIYSSMLSVYYQGLFEAWFRVCTYSNCMFKIHL